MAKILVGLLIALALPASAIVLVEPTTDEHGNPLGIAQTNALLYCAYWINGGGTAHWLPASAIHGGGTHVIPLPAIGDLPVSYTARCINRLGWGEEVNGTLMLTLEP